MSSIEEFSHSLLEGSNELAPFDPYGSDADAAAAAVSGDAFSPLPPKEQKASEGGLVAWFANG